MFRRLWYPSRSLFVRTQTNSKLKQFIDTDDYIRLYNIHSKIIHTNKESASIKPKILAKNAIWRANRNQDIGLQRVSVGLRECHIFN